MSYNRFSRTIWGSNSIWITDNKTKQTDGFVENRLSFPSHLKIYISGGGENIRVHILLLDNNVCQLHVLSLKTNGAYYMYLYLWKFSFPVDLIQILCHVLYMVYIHTFLHIMHMTYIRIIIHWIFSHLCCVRNRQTDKEQARWNTNLCLLESSFNTFLF